MKYRNVARRFGAKVHAAAAAVTLSMVTMPAFAAIDTTTAIAAVDDAKAFITTVGIAVLAMIFVAKGIKWARKAG